MAAEDRADDARYLRAAWQAIGGVEITEDAPEWIVKLGDVPLPPALLARVQNGAHLVIDAPRTAGVTRVTRSCENKRSTIALRQRVALERGAVLLTDSLGEPLITEERVGEGRQWRFAIQFHPDWSEWPVGDAFPAWWQEQLRPITLAPPAIAPEQAAPDYAPGRDAPAVPWPGLAAVDLRWSCWVAAALLLVFERWLKAMTRRKGVA